MFSNFPGSKKFLGAASAQIASSNQVLTSMGWGGPEGGGGCQASQVSAPHGPGLCRQPVTFCGCPQIKIVGPNNLQPGPQRKLGAEGRTTKQPGTPTCTRLCTTSGALSSISGL